MTSRQDRMPDLSMVALSAFVIGVAATAGVWALRGPGPPAAHRRLLVVCALVAALAAIPLVAAFAGPLYALYMPLTLPVLLALPLSIYAYLSELTRWKPGPPAPRYHLALPLAGIVVAVGYWLLPAAARDAMFLDGRLPEGPFPATLALATFALIAAWLLSSLAYVVAVLRRLAAYRAMLRDRYSNIAKRELRWIDWLMGALVILWGSVAATLISDNLGGGPILSGELVLAATAGLPLFIFALTPRWEAADGLEADDQVDGPEGKYARSALSDELAERLAGRIDSAMREDRLFLDPNLSLKRLARHVASPPNMVSQTLNERIGATFFDYVARWRIEAAKPMILAGDQSILAIAMEVGFNSRSTFYKAFRKETGLTPLAYGEAEKQGGTKSGG